MMFPQQNQPQQSEQAKSGDPIGVLYFIANTHATCITPFLRTGFGSEALGFPGLFALGILLFCMGAEPLMVAWLLAWLLAVVVQRIITLREIRRGAVIHSRYAGRPILMNLPFVKKERTAMVLEMFVCFTLGAFMLALSHFMGLFLMAGFLSLAIRHGIEDEVYRKRVQRMRDADIEQRALADRFRGHCEDY